MISQNLKEFLYSIKDKKILFVGIGNTLKADDAIGLYIVYKLEKIPLKNVYILKTGSSLENYLNKIVSLNPEVIIFIDALKNGNFDFSIFDEEEIYDKTFSTHNISLKTIIEFLKNCFVEKKLNVKFYVLAVKAENLSFGLGLSKKTKEIAFNIIKEICNSLEKKGI